MSRIKPDRFSCLIGNLWLAKPQIISQLKQQLSLVDSPLATLNCQAPAGHSNSISKAMPTATIPAAAQPVAKIAPREKALKIPSLTSAITPLAVSPVRLETTTSPRQSLITDWDELTATIKLCEQCKLCYGRQQVVIERGNRQAAWMFIGDGPGEEEDIQGRPFVGSSGQLLDKMIAAMNLDSESVYISNVVKCRPPHNRNLEAEEIKACSNYLLSQIQLVKPQLIITLGRYAAQTMLHSQLAVGKLRGKVHDYQGIPLIVTYHPAYLLRMPAAKKDAWDDLQLALTAFKKRA